MSSFALLLQLDATPRLPEQALWCAVVEVAIYDAMRGEREARRWIEGNSSNYKLVCNLAGIEPAYLQRLWRSYGR